jgi:hypothetical protein
VEEGGQTQRIAAAPEAAQRCVPCRCALQHVDVESAICSNLFRFFFFESTLLEIKMDSMAQREHLSIGQLLREATCRWLKGHEVLHILRNYKAEGYSHNRDVVRCPPSTSPSLIFQSILNTFVTKYIDR